MNTNKHFPGARPPIGRPPRVCRESVLTCRFPDAADRPRMLSQITSGPFQLIDPEQRKGTGGCP
jgi:hypothetical protein